jgi:hypothetical protein
MRPLPARPVHVRQACTSRAACLGEVARVVQARGTDVQPVGFAEGAAGFVGVANERGDRIAAREYAADDLAADAARGADHCGGHRVSFRYSSANVKWARRVA